METLEFLPGQTIRFKYTNWKGHTSVRTAQVISLMYGSTDWHQELQWLVQAIDTDKNEPRTFALRDMMPAD